MPYLLLLQIDLEREQQSEERLVILVQAAGRVLEHRERQVLDDVGDPLGGDGRLLRARHGDGEDAQELLEGGLVHDVHHGHLHDQEVQDAATCSHWRRMDFL